MQTPHVAGLQTALERALRRLCPAGQSVLAAVSGGVDSVVLLHGLSVAAPRLSIRVEVATVDHGLHPDSAGWAEGVERLAKALQVPCHRIALRLDPATTGLEAVAREARYRALEVARASAGLEWVATAHTASDQAETLLMRLGRGTSPAGARGIREARGDRVIRPLLFATRAEVESWAQALGVQAVRDPMNDDPAFLRTRLRRDVLPGWSAAAGFDVQPALARFARLSEEDELHLSEEARRAFERCALADGTLDLVAVTSLPLALRRRVLVRLLENADLAVDLPTLDEALRAVAEGGTATLSSGQLLTCTNDRVGLEAAPPRRKPS